MIMTFPYLLARITGPLMARPVARMRAPGRPLLLATLFALPARGSRHLCRWRVLDPVAVSGASVVAAGEEATALTAAGTGLER